MVSDSFDGYFARKTKSTSKFGAILDPTMDKFFVYFVLTVLFLEKNLQFYQVMMIISRDFVLVLYGIGAIFLRKWSCLHLRSIRWGKITTAMQFLIIIGLTLGYNFSIHVYLLFVLFAILAFIELLKDPDSKTFL